MDFLNTCFETTNEVRSLAYYSHLVPIVSSLFLGTLVYRYAKNRNKALLFTGFLTLLSLWLIGNLITWTSNNYYFVAGFWSVLDYLNILFYLFMFCFVVFDFINKRKLQILGIALSGLAAVFPFLLTVAGLAVHEFDEPNCEMYGNELLAVYKLGFEWTIIFSIAVVGIIATLRSLKNKSELKRIAASIIPTIMFLGIFSGSEFLSTYTEIYEINLYALFSLPIFILLLSFTIFEQKTFRFTIDSFLIVRILFLMFIIISASSLFLIESTDELLTTSASIIVTLGFAIMLLRSADKESKQLKQIETLADNLEKANTRLKALDKQKSEFVSIASHQLRSPLTTIRGYASLLLEGSYGKISAKAKEPIERIAQSSKLITFAIEDYLNVSRIESGNMRYNLADFNLRDEVDHACDDLRPDALKHGLVLIFRTDLKSRGIINADLGKTVQIIQNLIHNAIKYTVKGSVKVLVRDDVVRKKIFIDIIDTGIGMNQEALHTIFQKFERADNANTVNVHGTGLGLFVSLKMAEAMGGNITAYSEGDSKGSRFTIEFPLVM